MSDPQYGADDVEQPAGDPGRSAITLFAAIAVVALVAAIVWYALR